MFRNRKSIFVSILVLMDSFWREYVPTELIYENCGFNPCFNGFLSERKYCAMNESIKLCFNPCFNGFLSEREVLNISTSFTASFNPCFNGFLSERINKLIEQ